MTQSNPWKNIPLGDYEAHMRSDSVRQLQTLNRVMKDQIEIYPISSLTILGIAGGNGLEHIDGTSVRTVYGVDINGGYLEACKERYPELHDNFIPVCADITDSGTVLPQSDLIIANLLIEYIGLRVFTNKLIPKAHRYVSCVIQEDKTNRFVSCSPYEESLNPLTDLHRDISKEELISAMDSVGYQVLLNKEYDLPNGKAFHRIDFTPLNCLIADLHQQRKTCEVMPPILAK